MVHKKVHFNIKDLYLTPSEKEVLKALTEDYLTIKVIAQRRKSTKRAVYKIISNLKKKGAFDTGFNKGSSFDPVHFDYLNVMDTRLHGQEFNIKIISKSNKYFQRLKDKKTLFYLGNNTIRLYNNSLEIYSGLSFYGKDAQEAQSKSLEYWKAFFNRLEHELNIILIKPRVANISLVNQHYAHLNSEIAEKALEEGKQIKVFAQEDGKLAFITDDSFGFKEDETVHPKTAKNDREAIDKQVNDWRLNNPPTISEVYGVVCGVVQNQHLFSRNIRTHIKAIQDLGEGVNKWTNIGQELLNAIKELKGGKK